MAQRALPHRKPSNTLCVAQPDTFCSTGDAQDRILWTHAYAPPWVFQWPAQENPSSRGTSDDFTEMCLHSEVSILLHALGRTAPHEHHSKENVLRSDEVPLMTLITSFLLARPSPHLPSLSARRLATQHVSRFARFCGFSATAPAMRRKSASTRTTRLFKLIKICLSASLLFEILTSASVPSRGGTPSTEERLCRNFAPGCPILLLSEAS